MQRRPSKIDLSSVLSDVKKADGGNITITIVDLESTYLNVLRYSDYTLWFTL